MNSPRVTHMKFYKLQTVDNCKCLLNSYNPPQNSSPVSSLANNRLAQHYTILQRTSPPVTLMCPSLQNFSKTQSPKQNQSVFIFLRRPKRLICKPLKKSSYKLSANWSSSLIWLLCLLAIADLTYLFNFLLYNAKICRKKNTPKLAYRNQHATLQDILHTLQRHIYINHYTNPT